MMIAKTQTAIFFFDLIDNDIWLQTSLSVGVCDVGAQIIKNLVPAIATLTAKSGVEITDKPAGVLF